MEPPSQGNSNNSFPDSCSALDTSSACCAILNSISDAVCIIDPHTRIISFFNRAAEKLTGFREKEAIGQHCYDIFCSNVGRVDYPIEHTRKSGEPVYDYPSIISNKAGKEIAVNISTAAIKNDQGQVTGVVEIIRDLSLIETLRKAILSQYQLGDIVSKNVRMQAISEILPDIADSESTVLIQGASGTGKGIYAKAIHKLSPRRDRRFVEINCSAIPETLLESEMFGYVKGAFTDAKKDKPGIFSMANKGTLFLDEIGDMSTPFQAKLLKVIEEMQFIPLGGVRPVRTDVRLIAASNKDLEKLIKTGVFREDLYYRLNIIKLFLPPLSHRKEDIPLLVKNIIFKLNYLKKKTIRDVSDEVMESLMKYDYPGNIRELENILEHAYVICKSPKIQVKHLPSEFIEKIENIYPKFNTFSALENHESRIIQEALKNYAGNRTHTAKALGISRPTLWRKMKKFNLN